MAEYVEEVFVALWLLSYKDCRLYVTELEVTASASDLLCFTFRMMKNFLSKFSIAGC